MKDRKSNTLDVERAEDWLKRIGCKLPYASRELAELLHDYSLSCLPASDTSEPAAPTNWVSVKQELPPKAVRLLLWFQSLKNPHGKGVTLGEFPAWTDSENEGKYWDCAGLYRDANLITHWMYLPEAPHEPK